MTAVTQVITHTADVPIWGLVGCAVLATIVLDCLKLWRNK